MWNLGFENDLQQREAVFAPVGPCWPGTLLSSLGIRILWLQLLTLQCVQDLVFDHRAILSFVVTFYWFICLSFLNVCLFLFCLWMFLFLPVSQCTKRMCFLFPQEPSQYLASSTEKEAWNEVFWKVSCNFVNLKMGHLWDSSTCIPKNGYSFCFQVFHFKVLN